MALWVEETLATTPSIGEELPGHDKLLGAFAVMSGGLAEEG